MNQISKQILTILALILPLLAAGAALGGPIQTNPLTGIAMDGFDPVSYFTEPEPLEGRADFEHVWNGVPWHFANAANLEIFRRAPEVYAPQYGGHGAMELARGYLSQGNPRIHTIHAGRLYFFYSVANREAFLLAPGAAALEGQARWEALTGARAR